MLTSLKGIVEEAPERPTGERVFYINQLSRRVQ